MNDTIDKYLRTYLVDISRDAIDKFKSISIHKNFSKGETVIHYGKPTSKFYILEEGLVGSFLIDLNGKDFIRNIYTKNKAFGALSSLITGSKSNANYNCLTDCKVYEIDCNKFLPLSKNSNEFTAYYCKVLEAVYLRSEKKIDEISLLTTTDRYLNLKKELPDIDDILPQYQIAYYLNITPVQLSRIRKKLHNPN